MDMSVIGMLDIESDTIRVYSYNPDCAAGLELEEAVIYERSFESLLDFLDSGNDFWEFPDIKYFNHADGNDIIGALSKTYDLIGTEDEINYHIAEYLRSSYSKDNNLR